MNLKRDRPVLIKTNVIPYQNDHPWYFGENGRDDHNHASKSKERFLIKNYKTHKIDFGGLNGNSKIAVIVECFSKNCPNLLKLDNLDYSYK